MFSRNALPDGGRKIIDYVTQTVNHIFDTWKSPFLKPRLQLSFQVCSIRFISGMYGGIKIIAFHFIHNLIAKIKELEYRSAQIDAQMRALKAKNDAASIPETRLREYVQLMASADYNDVAVYLSIVYRVEVTKESITIWTIWDTNPDGTYDFDEEGVLLTPGVPSAPPIIFVTPSFLRIVVANRNTS